MDRYETRDEMRCFTHTETSETFLTVAPNKLPRVRMNLLSDLLTVCCQVIELDESNEKALYRRGEARLLCNEFSLAMADFQQVLQVNSSNRAARAQISICQGKIREHHELDKRTYANMFQKFAEHDAKVCTFLTWLDVEKRSTNYVCILFNS